jgi:hypothetical protein
LKAGDYFSINKTGKTVSEYERNQMAGDAEAVPRVLELVRERRVKMCRRVEI